MLRRKRENSLAPCTTCNATERYTGPPQPLRHITRINVYRSDPRDRMRLGWFFGGFEGVRRHKSNENRGKRASNGPERRARIQTTFITSFFRGNAFRETTAKRNSGLVKNDRCICNKKKGFCRLRSAISTKRLSVKSKTTNMDRLIYSFSYIKICVYIRIH